jgi:hypothetical protein
MTDEYARLVEDARDALGDLLRASEPGTGLTLHHSYNVLKLMAEQEAGDTDQEVADPIADEPANLLRGPDRRPWVRHTTVHERERQVIEMFGDDRLTVTELWRELMSAHDEWSVERSPVASIVNRLHVARELDRVGEPYCGRTRYRYFRRTKLEGPIADLQRQFDEGA